MSPAAGTAGGGTADAGSAGAGTAFGALCEVVLADPKAQSTLRATRGWEDFVTTAAAVAAEHGISIGPADLEVARREARGRLVGRGL